jgi:16S rRNA (cytosine967-C5)-methyltransferase
VSADRHGRHGDDARSSAGASGSGRDERGRQRGPARASGRSPARTELAPAQRRRSGDPARTAAYDVLREVADSDAYANLVLPQLLRRRGVVGRDAAFATELAYGTLRLRGRYDAAISCAVDRPLEAVDPPVLDLLRLGAHQHLGMRVPAHAAVSETVALARSCAGAGAAQFVNAVLRRIAADDLETWRARILDFAGSDPADRLAAWHSHPAWVVRALHQALVADGRDPTELEMLLEADNAAPAVTLVARPGLITRAELARDVWEAKEGRWTPTALIAGGGDPGALLAVREGRAGVQDEGSQLVALALAAVDVGDEHRWLDLAAGPGGKAALLGAVASSRGVTVVASEIQPHRVALVERSVAALPAGTVEVRCADGRELGSAEPAGYDRVLVDAPCTGLGALRRRPEARWRRRPEDLPMLTRLQRELLDSALDAVRPGGVVGYVTCSPHVAETRAVVADALRRRSDVEQLDARESISSVAGDAIKLGEGPAVQLWPHVHGTDGMHLALLRRK